MSFESEYLKQSLIGIWLYRIDLISFKFNHRKNLVNFRIMALSEYIRKTPSGILSVMGYACHIAEIWLSQGNRL